MNASSFYLVLPANASGEEFPENKNSSYKVRLSERLRLDGALWECALVDLFYTNNWNNIVDGHMTVYANGTRHRLTVKTGRHSSIESVVQSLQQQIDGSSLKESLALSYDEVGEVVVMEITKPRVSVSFSDDLAGAFGFKKDHVYESKPLTLGEFASMTREEYREMDKYASETHPDIHQGFTSLYVYCSLCENRLVGDSSVRLLRVLPVKQKKDRNCYEEVRNPHYVPVANTDTDVVEVNISRDDGTLVPFKGGKVIVTVHLRKRG
jgi:hypothetical protein